MKAIQVHQYGGPEVLQSVEVPLPEPGEGEARVKIGAAGVNFIDVYHRTGAYSGQLPLTPGVEGAGQVDQVGPGVKSVREGDSVVYNLQIGAYAEYAIVPVEKLFQIPAGVEVQTAAAAMLQGLTAHYLTHSTYPLQPGDLTLIHAAAGGVGLLLVQMAKMRGAHVIGTVSTEEKAELARQVGADEIILYTQTDFEEGVKRLTGGSGVHVVYDSVGKTTFDKSLKCLRRRGYLVLFGQSSGAVPKIDPQTLNANGSLFLTRPSLGHYVAERSELEMRCQEMFDWIAAGKLKVRIDRTFPLDEAPKAHRYLQDRKTKGKLLLIP
jgi:NADPH2:quinone reductase